MSRPLADKKTERPASLYLPATTTHHHHPPYATLRPQSLCPGGSGRCGGGPSSPLASPRCYNSLPNLKGLVYEQSGSGTWSYQSHPRDEEKRLAYTRGQLNSTGIKYWYWKQVRSTACSCLSSSFLSFSFLFFLYCTPWLCTILDNALPPGYA